MVAPLGCVGAAAAAVVVAAAAAIAADPFVSHAGAVCLSLPKTQVSQRS